MSRGNHRQGQGQGQQQQSLAGAPGSNNKPSTPETDETTVSGQPPKDPPPDPDKGDDEATPSPGGEAKSEYHVVGPGSALVDGSMVPPGETVLLSQEAAKALGKSVRGGPPRREAIGERGAGKYRVVGPGSVCVGGKFRAPGEAVQLSAEDARSFGAVVSPVAP